MSRARSFTVSRRSRTAMVVACAAMAMVAVTAHARAASGRVVVRIYDTANVAAEVRGAALREAARILDEAGVAIAWHDCTSGTDVLQCGKSPDNWNLIVRIVPTFVPGSPARSAVRAGAAGAPLGLAVFDPDMHGDAMATLFEEQILTVAARVNADRGALLGRALAHEVGHLLLLASGHSRTGLMRAVWTDAELAENRPDDWVFAPADRRRLQLNSSPR